MDFRDCVGKEFLFYGVDNHMLKIDNDIWEAIEDDTDGLRSMCAEVKHHDSKGTGIFFREPIAIVRVEEDHDREETYANGYTTTYDEPNDGYKLVDVDYEHTWLEFGTQYHDSYYPCFYFSYTPRLEPKPKNKPARGRTIVHDPFDRFFEDRES